MSTNRDAEEQREARTKPLVMAVDDEPDIAELIQVSLARSGFTVETFDRAAPFLETLHTRRPDLVLLDLMLPDMDGLEVCKTLKADPEHQGIPIIMLTARGDETDIVLGLELGADDYLVKPFSTKELAARIRAVLRRRATRESGAPPPRVRIINSLLAIDVNQHAARVNGEDIGLTKTEFALLKILCEHPTWVFSREKLLNLLWGDEKDVIDRTIDVHIKNLREKLGAAGYIIQNVRGVGYKIEP
jgi:two-component system phosphate regulon response regulator PhoB/two-component system alkaline phosphatase synthesis response regulator PhoP